MPFKVSAMLRSHKRGQNHETLNFCRPVTLPLAHSHGIISHQNPALICMHSIHLLVLPIIHSLGTGVQEPLRQVRPWPDQYFFGKWVWPSPAHAVMLQLYHLCYSSILSLSSFTPSEEVPRTSIHLYSGIWSISLVICCVSDHTQVHVWPHPFVGVVYISLTNAIQLAMPLRYQQWQNNQT